MLKPKKWIEVYPQGTKEGDEEQKFFIALGRNEKYAWRSIAMIAKESGLSKKRIEELLAKYHKMGLVFQSSTNEDNWGYWERVPEMLKDNTKSISDKDQEKRINSSLQDISSKNAFIASSQSPILDFSKNQNSYLGMMPKLFREMLGKCDSNISVNYNPNFDQKYYFNYIVNPNSNLDNLNADFIKFVNQTYTVSGDCLKGTYSTTF